MKKLFFLVVLLSLFAHVYSQEFQYDFNSRCTQAYQQMIHLQLESAHELMELEIQENPHNLIPHLLENYYDFLRIVLYEDQELFEALSHQKKIRLSKWKEGDKDSPWYLSGQAQIKLQWAFSRVLFDDYFTAATEINSAYHLLEENKQKHPDFLADNMGIGILHAMIGVVPEQYQWALDMLGIYGSIDQGVAEIKKQIDDPKNHPFNVEALFYYTFVRLNLQSDSTRFTELLHYYQNQPYLGHSQQSPLLSFSKAVVLLKVDNDRAIDFLETLSFDEEETNFFYNDYLLGQALLFQLNPVSYIYLEKYIQDYTGKNYKKSALQRQAWNLFIQGDTLGYQDKMRRVLMTGTDLLDADKSAKKEAKAMEKGYLPNLYLLRGRLQFDGHYYTGAIEELDKLNPAKLNHHNLLEYHYRKGRIYHELRNYESAKKEYLAALLEGKDDDSYYGANAALKLGEIAEFLGNFADARHYYKTCLDLDFSEYRRGIRAKAKAGLQRIEGMI